MRVQPVFLAVPLLVLSACGGGDDKRPARDGGAAAPSIGINMKSPVEDPLCYFVADTGSPIPVTGPDARYVFVTEMSGSGYRGHATLDGVVTALEEVEAGFGAGMETRRYVNDASGVELEVILLDEVETEASLRYKGSVRVIYPVEGEAVKFYGECRYGEDAE